MVYNTTLCNIKTVFTRLPPPSWIIAFLFSSLCLYKYVFNECSKWMRPVWVSIRLRWQSSSCLDQQSTAQPATQGWISAERMGRQKTTQPATTLCRGLFAFDWFPFVIPELENKKNPDKVRLFEFPLNGKTLAGKRVHLTNASATGVLLSRRPSPCRPLGEDSWWCRRWGSASRLRDTDSTRWTTAVMMMMMIIKLKTSRRRGKLTDDGVVLEGHFGQRQVFYQQADCEDTRVDETTASGQSADERKDGTCAGFGTYLPASSALHLNPCGGTTSAWRQRKNTLGQMLKLFVFVFLPVLFSVMELKKTKKWNEEMSDRVDCWANEKDDWDSNSLSGECFSMLPHIPGKWCPGRTCGTKVGQNKTDTFGKSADTT